MARKSLSAQHAIERFDQYSARLDGHVPMRPLPRPGAGRIARSLVARAAGMGIGIAALIVATIAFGFIVGPIGIGGLLLVAAAMVFVVIFFAAWPARSERATKPFDAQMPNREVVRRLDTILARKQPVLPAPAASRVDAISRQLPLLESKLAEMDLLDPLAQDARRLMGKHLPDLIERYEKVPAEYRSARDGEGMTVDERLVAGLEAARTAIDDLGAKLTRTDLDAFETQGRFIESRYKDGGAA